MASKPPCATPGEFKNPKTDTFKAIFYSGLLCVVVYTLVPFAFPRLPRPRELWCIPRFVDAAGQVTTAAEYSGMLAPDIYSGMGVAAVMARMVHAGRHRRSGRRDHADPRAGALAHDLHGRLLAHALSGVGRRLAAEVSRQGQRARRADQCHAHQSRDSISCCCCSPIRCSSSAPPTSAICCSIS